MSRPDAQVAVRPKPNLWACLLLALALVAMVLLAPSEAQAAARRCPVGLEIIDHRGAHGLHDENSVQAIEAAARRGESVEVDTRQTATPGADVLVHDATWQRRGVYDATGRVDETPIKQALTITGTRYGEPVASLEQGLRAARAYGVPVYLDIKGGTRAHIETVAATIRSLGMTGSVFVTSWTAKVARVAPDLRLVYKPDHEPVTAAEVAATGAQAVGLHARQMSQPLIDQVRAEGIVVQSRLANTEPVWAEVFGYTKVTAMLTDTPIALRRWCAGPGAF